MDAWIVGESPISARKYVVHLAFPRFALEIVELEHETWNPGALVWMDDPGTTGSAGWTRRAGEVYFAHGRVASAFPTWREPMSGIAREIREALLTAEDALRTVVSQLDPFDARDAFPMKQTLECYGVVAGMRRDLESGRWPGRGPVPPTDGSPDSR